MSPTDTDVPPRAIPSLLSLAVAYSLLVIASVAALAFLRHDTALRGMAALNPFGPPESSRLLFATNPDAIRASAFLCFASALPLGIYTAIIVSRLQRLGARDAESYIAFAGGLSASAGLAAAGLLLWVLSVPEVAGSVAVARALHFLIFLTGGPAFAAGMGLLAAGVSRSNQFAHILPKWVVWLGHLIAATGALSTLGMLSVPMTVAIPLTRFGGIVWLIVVGARLRRDRPGAGIVSRER